MLIAITAPLGMCWYIYNYIYHMFPWYCLPVADAMVTECRQDAPSELEKRCLTRCGAVHGGFSMVPQMEALWKSPLKWKKTGGPHGNWKPSNMIVFAKPPMKSNELLRCFCCLRVLMLFIPSVWISGMIFDETDLRDFEGFVVPPQRLSPVETWRKRPSSWWQHKLSFRFFPNA